MWDELGDLQIGRVEIIRSQAGGGKEQQWQEAAALQFADLAREGETVRAGQLQVKDGRIAGLLPGEGGEDFGGARNGGDLGAPELQAMAEDAGVADASPRR